MSSKKVKAKAKAKAKAGGADDEYLLFEGIAKGDRRCDCLGLWRRLAPGSDALPPPGSPRRAQLDGRAVWQQQWSQTHVVTNCFLYFDGSAVPTWLVCNGAEAIGTNAGVLRCVDLGRSSSPAGMKRRPHPDIGSWTSNGTQVAHPKAQLRRISAEERAAWVGQREAAEAAARHEAPAHLMFDAPPGDATPRGHDGGARGAWTGAAGVYELRRGALKNGRCVWQHAERDWVLFYAQHNRWLVGTASNFESSGTVATNGFITGGTDATWHNEGCTLPLPLSGTWGCSTGGPPSDTTFRMRPLLVGELASVRGERDAGVRAALLQAQELGDIVIDGQLPSEPCALCMGAYELQPDRVINGRAVWKAAAGNDRFIYYADCGAWMVGAEESMLLGRSRGLLKATSAALTPDRIDTLWDVFTGDEAAPPGDGRDKWVPSQAVLAYQLTDEVGHEIKAEALRRAKRAGTLIMMTSGTARRRGGDGQCEMQVWVPMPGVVVNQRGVWHSQRVAIDVGSQVLLCGLRSAPELNGTTGTVTGEATSTERWPVRCADGAVRAVKMENCMLTPAGASSSAPAMLQHPEEWLYFAGESGKWGISEREGAMRIGDAAGKTCVSSAALSPNDITETWQFVLMSGAWVDITPDIGSITVLRLMDMCSHCFAVDVDTDHAFKLCSGCKKVRYCCGACQKAAWKTHKPKCRTKKKTRATAEG